MVPCCFTSSAIDLLQVVWVGLFFFFLLDSSQGLSRLVGLFSEGVSYPCPFSSYNLFADAVLVCPRPDFFIVCGFILPFGFQEVSQTFVNECSIRVVVLVALHVSETYSSILFTLVLKILILFRVEKVLHCL